MKRLVGWMVAWSLFWTGDLVSRVMDYWPWEKFHPYYIYNRLMIASSRVQVWGRVDGPWKDQEIKND